jgi:putative ABC transport system permease protein
MAADLSARMFQQPTPEEHKGLVAIEAESIEITHVTELLSMASAAKTLDPLLVSLKAVDPALYPFYGEVELQPAGRLKDVLTGDTVVVADDLLVRLRLNVGDSLKIGNRIFRIASAVVNEPHRPSGRFAAGPRLFISRWPGGKRAVGAAATLDSVSVQVPSPRMARDLGIGGR